MTASNILMENIVNITYHINKYLFQFNHIAQNSRLEISIWHNLSPHCNGQLQFIFDITNLAINVIYAFYCMWHCSGRLGERVTFWPSLLMFDQKKVKSPCRQLKVISDQVLKKGLTQKKTCTISISYPVMKKVVIGTVLQVWSTNL